MTSLEMAERIVRLCVAKALTVPTSGWTNEEYVTCIVQTAVADALALADGSCSVVEWEAEWQEAGLL